jgi:flavin reductase (DIM6/NTAB) family NADH-FMN oxidoreductase RutF
VFGAYLSGVTAVAALIEGAPVGITASSFTSISLDLALVLVSSGVRWQDNSGGFTNREAIRVGNPL